MRAGKFLETVKKFPWWDLLLVAALIIFDITVHPLSTGPDRLIHDPAVYRLGNPDYLPGDWYTDMAVKSGAYVFYAKLVNAYSLFHLPQEIWRQLLYIISLVVTYYSIIRIARLFNRSWLVIPIVALLHIHLVGGVNQPVWLYGPFLQIDGGLAPRSIGMAASFLALYFLLRGSILVPAAILGLATLIHVSNSLIVFTLFWLIWLVIEYLKHRPTKRAAWLEIARPALQAVGLYLIAGGWFALYVASRDFGQISTLSTEKFIWAWINLRAPYMALPTAGVYWWYRFYAHIAAIIIGWLILRKLLPEQRKPLNILAMVGLGAIGYFYLFYLFTFIKPWLLGFQFYSLRVVYLAYFVAYLFIALSFVLVGRLIINKLTTKTPQLIQRWAPDLAIAVVTLVLLLNSPLMKAWSEKAQKSLHLSWAWLSDINRPPPSFATFRYLYTKPEPFLAPLNWNTYGYYLPRIVSFKSFGFTKTGLAEWYERMNDVSRGEIEKVYQAQQQTGQMGPVEFDWTSMYSQLTADEVQALAKKYHFRLFLTYSHLSYPFPVVAEDPDFRIYQLPES